MPDICWAASFGYNHLWIFACGIAAGIAGTIVVNGFGDRGKAMAVMAIKA
ncbi:hypothetical protein [Mesorhizobium sp.]|nr:hypothetical protein [Mesorhizobium sp.]